MPVGPGKYDEILFDALKAAERQQKVRLHGGILIILGPPGHMGFEVHVPPELMHKIPPLLREMADHIEADVKTMGV